MQEETLECHKGQIFMPSNRCPLNSLKLFLAVVAALALALPAAAEEEPPEFSALILKIKGKGFAKIRKKSNTEGVAGAGQHFYPGDRVSTDGDVIVHLALNDGSLIRLGPASDLRLASATLNPATSSIAWRFELGKGAVLVRAEPLLKQDAPPLTFEAAGKSARILDGTVLLESAGEAKGLAVTALEGKAEFGESGCEARKQCKPVPSGKLSPNAPASTLMFFAGEKIGAPAGKPEDRIKEALEEVAAAQDRLIGRTKEEREAMAQARRDGSYQPLLQLGLAYALAKNVYDPRVNGGAEAYLAQVQAEQFRLGKMVRDALVALGPRFDPAIPALQLPAMPESIIRQIKARKGYHSSEEVGRLRKSVADALDQFNRVLAFADAVHPGTSSNASEEQMFCEERSCLQTAIENEFSAMDEGIVHSYGKREHKQAANLQSTQYFSRTAPGCFKMVQDCRKKTVAGCAPGKKCKASPSNPRVCSMRQMFVPCE
jgi:FecR protein